MSNEITISVGLKCRNGNLETAFNPSTLLVSQSSQVAAGGVQIIGTSTNCEAIVLGDVTTAGYAWFRNCDATNYVDVGTATGTSFISTMRLLAGEIAICPLHPTNAITAKANGGNVNLQYTVLSR